MQPGEFDEVIAIERSTRTRDDVGGTLIAWATIAEGVFAKVIRPTARDMSKEAALGGRVSEERALVFKLRYPADITATDRIIFDGDAYGVEGIVTDKGEGVISVNGVYRAGTDGR